MLLFVFVQWLYNSAISLQGLQLRSSQLLQRKTKVNGEKRTTVWGSGLAKREYMHVDDCAEGVVFVSDKIDDGSLVNIAPGTELTTRQTAEAIAEIVGYEGELEQDTTKPDGTMRKLASSERIEELGWKPRIDFFEGLRETYDAFKEELERFSLRSSRV